MDEPEARVPAGPKEPERDNLVGADAKQATRAPPYVFKL